jgi:peptidoglycan/LPS O-acetylase OafA/YrhL
MSPSSKRIPSLDGLRAIAILLVLVSHLAGSKHFLSMEAVGRIGDLGNLGVRLFFVISGFLITRLLLGEFAKTQQISLRTFYVRRLLRIFPAFYAFIIVATLLSTIGFATIDRRDFISAITYTMNYRPMHPDTYTLRHLWSLAVEEQFYVVWPITLALLLPRRAAGVLVGVILFVPVLRVVLYMLVPGYEYLANSGFEGVCDALATGCLLAMTMDRMTRAAWIERALASRAFPLIFVAILLANKQHDHPKFFWLLCVPFMNVALALTILRYVAFPGGVGGQLLNSKPLATIGVLSYSLYLWQQLFLIQWRPANWIVMTFPLNVVMAFLAAGVSYALIEQPFLRLKDRFEPRAYGSYLKLSTNRSNEVSHLETVR